MSTIQECNHRVYDSLYGYISLTVLEHDLVTSPVFQRLQWIKQMGPANIIFPSAQHSRYSHLLGVFHIVKKMINHFKERDLDGFYKELMSKQEEKELRFAALLHDIGHVPFSHTGEKALEDVYNEGPRENETKINLVDDTTIVWKSEFDVRFRSDGRALHECLSAEVVRNNKEIEDVLKADDPDVSDVGEFVDNIAKLIVGKHENPRLNMMLHSELDADRIDYLLRDSDSTGVAYGHIDLEYIVSKLRVEESQQDGDKIICVDFDALHSVEHYLLARFFMHMQVVYDEKVRLLDIILCDLMKYMMKHHDKKWSIINLRKLLDHIRSQGPENDHPFYEYTDALVFTKMRGLHNELDAVEKDQSKNNSLTEEDTYINLCTKMIMDAQLPDAIERHQKLFSLENEGSMREVMTKKANDIADKIADDLSIPRRYIKVSVDPRRVLKYTEQGSNEKPERAKQNKEAVRIHISGKEQERVIYAVKSNASILKHLIDQELIVFNVFYVHPTKQEDEEYNKRKKKIKNEFRDFIHKYFFES